MKVLFLNNIPVPYRIDFFNELGRYCDLTVLMETDHVPHLNNNWLKSHTIKNFNYMVLPSLFSGKEVRINYTLFQNLKKNKYDIIVIGGYSSITQMAAILYLKLKKIPFILNCDGGIIKQDKKIIKLIKTAFISSANYWLSTGVKTDQYLINYGANKNKIYRYPFTSIKKEDILLAKNQDEINYIKKEMNIENKKVIIGVGQFIHRKGFDILINAFSQIKSDAILYIIGGKPTEEYLQLVEKKQIANVRFIEFKEKKELHKFYKIADIFVLPTREDVWGLVINEAMSFGLPVITTDSCVAGLELIEEDANGYIVETDSISALTYKIEYLLLDEDKINIIFENNVKKIQKYTIESMANAHIKIFNQILKRCD